VANLTGREFVTQQQSQESVAELISKYISSDITLAPSPV